MATLATFDPKELEAKVKAMYRSVAEDPHGEFHFEMGRALAERLGYPRADLDRIPAEAIESFAGVGYYFDLVGVKEGETVIDFGSGSGMDTFIAALKVGPRGKVIGVDMTDEQRTKAERLRDRDGFTNVTYIKAYIDNVPIGDASADVVISNGVINLATDKAAVFR
jgi:arsenite methyltransferase